MYQLVNVILTTTWDLVSPFQALSNPSKQQWNLASLFRALSNSSKQHETWHIQSLRTTMKPYYAIHLHQLTIRGSNNGGYLPKVFHNLKALSPLGSSHSPLQANHLRTKPSLPWPTICHQLHQPTYLGGMYVSIYCMCYT